MNIEAPVIWDIPDKPLDKHLDEMIDEARRLGEVTYRWLGKIATLKIEAIENASQEV